jgi:hypothetical protein
LCTSPYRDKKVVGVFVRFRAPLQQDTKITHMYASEHTIDSEFKDSVGLQFRSNRKKHTILI